jgi:hypothetical protein
MVESKFVQYSQGNYILSLTSRYFFRSFTNARLLFVVSHSNDITSCQSSSAENISSRHSFIILIKHLVSDRLLSLISKENVHNVR